MAQPDLSIIFSSSLRSFTFPQYTFATATIMDLSVQLSPDERFIWMVLSLNGEKILLALVMVYAL